MTTTDDIPRTVLVSAPIHPDGLAMLKDFDLRIHHYKSSLPDGGMPSALLAEADALIVRGMPVTRDTLAAAPRLRVVAKHGAGVNNIDLSACSARGIVVANTGDANADSVAQLAVSLMLAAQRRLPAVHRSVTEGRYDQYRSSIFPDLLERTVGVVGLGAIGRKVARICRLGFDARIIAYDPMVDMSTMRDMGVEKREDLDGLIAEADVVTLHLPLLEGTRHLISRERLGRMKPNAVLVNTARGGIVDEAALVEALEQGRIAGAGLDSFEEEPLLRSRLFDLDNVVLSPHIGGATELSRSRQATRSAQAVIDVLAGRHPAFPVNGVEPRAAAF